MNKFYYLLICIISCYENGYSQDYFTEKIVIAQPHLNMREKPNKNSEIIAQIPFWKKVEIYDGNNYIDTVNGITGYWYKAKYDNKEGFVWSQYLGNFYLSDDTIVNIDFQILHEGYKCSGFNYSPELNWYGLYKTEDSTKQELLKVELQFIFKNTTSEEEKNKYFKDEYGADLIVKTNREKESLLIIGAYQPLKEGTISGILFGQYEYNSEHQPNFLYPEQIKDLTLPTTNTLAIKAKVEAEIADTLKLKTATHYEIELASTVHDYYSYDKHTTQNISNDIPFMRNHPSIHSIYKTPKIIWYGDIDNDGKIDFLIKSTYMQDTCGAETYTILFVSSSADKGNFVKKVAYCVSDWCY